MENLLSLLSNKKAIGYLKLFIVIFLWGINYHVAKYLVTEADIFTLSFLRFVIAGIVLIVMYSLNNSTKVKMRDISKKQWQILLMVGFCFFFIYNIFFLGASRLISANRVAILYAFTPCITVFFSIVFFKQRINFLASIGTIVALLGTIGVVSIAGNSSQSNEVYSMNLFVGQALALLAAISMACHNILNRIALQNGLDSLTITTFGAIFGTLFLLVTFVFFGSTDLSVIATKSFKFWSGLIFISLLATILCYKWYSDAIQEIGISQTVIFQNGVPLFAVLVGAILGQHIPVGVLLYGLVIVLGVLITNIALANK